MSRRVGCGIAVVAAVLVVGGITKGCGGGPDSGSPPATRSPVATVTINDRVTPTPPATTVKPGRKPKITHTAKPTHRTVKRQHIPADARGPYAVIRVVDGDTVHVSVNGHDTDVRLIGVDTPEVYGGVECYGRQASAETHALLDGRSVYVEYDPAQPRHDRYGRTLAYVWLGNRLVNRNLILHGYGHAETQYGLYMYESSFLHAEDVAQLHNRGLWSAC